MTLAKIVCRLRIGKSYDLSQAHWRKVRWSCRATSRQCTKRVYSASDLGGFRIQGRDHIRLTRMVAIGAIRSEPGLILTSSGAAITGRLSLTLSTVTSTIVVSDWPSGSDAVTVS